MAAGDAAFVEFYSTGQRKVEVWTLTSNAGTGVTITCKHLTHISFVTVTAEESHGAATANNATWFATWSGTTVTVTEHAGLTADKKWRVRIEGW